MATLVGINLFIGSFGGSIGAWVAGKIFDTTQSYQGAFIAGTIAGFISILLIFLLRRQDRIMEKVRNHNLP